MLVSVEEEDPGRGERLVEKDVIALLRVAPVPSEVDDPGAVLAGNRCSAIGGAGVRDEHLGEPRQTREARREVGLLVLYRYDDRDGQVATSTHCLARSGVGGDRVWRTHQDSGQAFNWFGGSGLAWRDKVPCRGTGAVPLDGADEGAAWRSYRYRSLWRRGCRAPAPGAKPAGLALQPRTNPVCLFG